MGESSSSAEQVETLTGPQKDLLNKLAKLLNEQVGVSAEGYPGQIVPEASQLQQQLFGAASQFGNQLGGGLASLLSGTPLFGPDTEGRDKIYAAQRDLAQQEFDDFSRQIMERYAGRGGARGGGVLRSLTRGATRLATNLNASRAGLEYQDTQAYRQEQQAAQNRIATGAQAGQIGLGTLGGIGTMQRNIAGQQLAGDYNQWEAQQAYNNPWLQYLPQVFGTPAFTVGTNQQQAGLLGGLLDVPGWFGA